MKRILLMALILLVACSPESSESDSGSTNEYEIYTRVSFKENIYTMYVNYIHDEKQSFVRYEQNDQTNSYFEDTKTYLAEDKIGIEIESKTTVATQTIDVQIRNVGSGNLLVSETIDKSIAYNIPGHHKVRLIFDVDTQKIIIEFLD